MIKLFNDDCLNILNDMKINNFDFSKVIFVSDPPFNVGYHYTEYKDNKEENEYYIWLKSIFGNNKQVIIHYPEGLYRHSFNIGILPEKVVSWVYNSNTAKQHRDIAFFGIKPDFSKVGQSYKNPTDKRIRERIMDGKMARLYDWWEVNQIKNTSKEKTVHPCQMPIKVMTNIIGILPEEYTIIDPFMGVGSTGIACQILNRNFIGIELSKEYYNIAEQRINDVEIEIDFT